MIRISTLGRYALRAMVDVVQLADGFPVLRRDIAERESISADYVAQLFRELADSELVEGVKGPGGGDHGAGRGGSGGGTRRSGGVRSSRRGPGLQSHRPVGDPSALETIVRGRERDARFGDTGGPKQGSRSGQHRGSSKRMTAIYTDITETVGGTPLVRLNRITEELEATMAAKL